MGDIKTCFRIPENYLWSLWLIGKKNDYFYDDFLNDDSKILRKKNLIFYIDFFNNILKFNDTKIKVGLVFPSA